MSARPKQGVRRIFHRNGVVAVEENFCGQKLHGRRRTWHRNGQLATEEFYLDGRLHGVVRQWNENGKLLGSYQMEHGTGTQKSWHDNGRLNLEFATVERRILRTQPDLAAGRNFDFRPDSSFRSERHARRISQGGGQRPAFAETAWPDRKDAGQKPTDAETYPSCFCSCAFEKAKSQ